MKMAFGNRYSGINTLSKTLTQVEKKSGDSQFWSRLMSVKQNFLKRVTFRYRMGNKSVLGRQVVGELGP